jgi:hypothetical protein
MIICIRLQSPISSLNWRLSSETFKKESERECVRQWKRTDHYKRIETTQ